MKPLGPVRRHYWLLQDMARTTGVDLAAALERGTIEKADWAGMVRACRECDWDKGCRRWLRGGPEVDVAPRDCRNRTRLAALRIEQELAR